ncbi:putative Diphthine--ammonia ligase protein [Naja naja]|nr:putative Diphthine--ammonia ligase protein [Naja naja]
MATTAVVEGRRGFLVMKYGVHICGEGGEYETFTLDCPLFKKKIVVDSSEVVVHSADAFAPVAYLRLLKLHLEDKASPTFQGIIQLQITDHVTELMGKYIGLPKIVQFGDKILPGKCSCDTKEIEDCACPPSDGRKETPCITWQFLRPNFAQEKVPTKPATFCGGYLSLLEKAHMNLKGLALTDIILVHLYMKSMADFAVINSVYMTAFDLCPPARVCVEAPLTEDLLFQMDCLAQKDDKMISGASCSQKQVMHVQSISHWAPANIGPYSQCIQMNCSNFHVVHIQVFIQVHITDYHLTCRLVLGRPQQGLSGCEVHECRKISMKRIMQDDGIGHNLHCPGKIQFDRASQNTSCPTGRSWSKLGRNNFVICASVISFQERGSVLVWASEKCLFVKIILLKKYLVYLLFIPDTTSCLRDFPRCCRSFISSCILDLLRNSFIAPVPDLPPSSTENSPLGISLLVQSGQITKNYKAKNPSSEESAISKSKDSQQFEFLSNYATASTYYISIADSRMVLVQLWHCPEFELKLKLRNFFLDQPYNLESAVDFISMLLILSCIALMKMLSKIRLTVNPYGILQTPLPICLNTETPTFFPILWCIFICSADSENSKLSSLSSNGLSSNDTHIIYPGFLIFRSGLMNNPDPRNLFIPIQGRAEHTELKLLEFRSVQNTGLNTRNTEHRPKHQQLQPEVPLGHYWISQGGELSFEETPPPQYMGSLVVCLIRIKSVGLEEIVLGESFQGDSAVNPRTSFCAADEAAKLQINKRLVDDPQSLRKMYFKYFISKSVEDTLYCSGQIALVPCTMQLTSGGIKKEALMSLNHVERVLKAMNLKAELHHVLMANCYTTDSRYISVAEAVWQRKLKELTKFGVVRENLKLLERECWRHKVSIEEKEGVELREKPIIKMEIPNPSISSKLKKMIAELLYIYGFMKEEYSQRSCSFEHLQWQVSQHIVFTISNCTVSKLLGKKLLLVEIQAKKASVTNTSIAYYMTKEEDINNDMPAIHGELVVVVVPFLPRAASIEWHVIAVVDQQQQRQKLTQMRSLESCQIRCDAIQSYPTCATAVTISLTLTSSSASTINLDVVLHGMVEMFKQVVEKMSKYGDITPLSFRTFFRTNIVKREPLKTVIRHHSKKCSFQKTALIPCICLQQREDSTKRYDSVGIAQADNSQMCKHEKEIDGALPQFLSVEDTEILEVSQGFRPNHTPEQVIVRIMDFSKKWFHPTATKDTSENPDWQESALSMGNKKYLWRSTNYVQHSSIFEMMDLVELRISPANLEMLELTMSNNKRIVLLFARYRSNECELNTKEQAVHLEDTCTHLECARFSAHKSYRVHKALINAHSEISFVKLVIKHTFCGKKHYGAISVVNENIDGMHKMSSYFEHGTWSPFDLYGLQGHLEEQMGQKAPALIMLCNNSIVDLLLKHLLGNPASQRSKRRKAMFNTCVENVHLEGFENNCF